jgi:hypothetical protein
MHRSSPNGIPHRDNHSNSVASSGRPFKIRRSAGGFRVRVGVHKLPMNSPNDVSALGRLIDAGEVNPSEIVALIGKTEGNGGANDFTRGFATLSYSLALAPRLGVSPDESQNGSPSSGRAALRAC